MVKRAIVFADLYRIHATIEEKVLSTNVYSFVILETPSTVPKLLKSDFVLTHRGSKILKTEAG